MSAATPAPVRRRDRGKSICDEQRELVSRPWALRRRIWCGRSPMARAVAISGELGDHEGRERQKVVK